MVRFLSGLQSQMRGFGGGGGYKLFYAVVLRCSRSTHTELTEVSLEGAE